jgi:hypothetical protein
VSYTDEEELRKTLAEHKIEVVLSTTSSSNARTFEAQVNLIRACAASDSVKRFAPSEWLLDFEKTDSKSQFGRIQRDIVTELRKHPNLEWTLFHTGYFMDYFGQPWAPTHMPSEVPFVDIEACQATIPGTGEEKVVWTHTTDVAKFVSRAVSMSLGTWKEDSWIVGDKVTFHQILAAAEKARGVKFSVTYDSLEKLKSGKVTPIPANKAHAALYSTPEYDATEALVAMFAMIGAAMAGGDLDVEEKDSLNVHFLDIETVKVVDFIEKYWSGK